jgi:hypothetical protein
MKTSRLIAMVVIVIFIVLYYLPPTRRSDVLLNLFSDGIGILVAVLIIDQLIKSRDEARRKPSQKITYARLFEITSDVIESIVPEGGLRVVLLDADVVVFGPSRVSSRIDSQQLQRRLPAMFHEIYENLKKHKQFDTANLSKASHKTMEIIDNSSFLLEVELLNLLFQMDNGIKSVDNGLSLAP